MKVTAQLYGQFLLSSQINYTATYLGDHLEGITHDNVQYFLKASRVAPRQVWQHVRHQIQLDTDGYILFDDTVLNKEHSHKIELVRRQYSGNAHGIIKGIGVVNCVYFNPKINQFWLIDYRIFNPDEDGKSKLDHVLDMLNQLAPRQISYRIVLMDSWYAVTDLFKWLITNEKLFYCPIKSNRKVDDSGGKESYQPVSYLSWSAQQVQQGKLVKVHKMPQNTYLKLFRVLVSTHRTDYIVTNDLAQNETSAAEEKSGIRWTIEQFHREDKQITGLECCQCRLARSQRNHIGLAALTWLRFKQLAYQTKKTVYQLKQGLLDAYLRQELANPSVAFA
ncbi:IS701 family transposase [Spirosoma foliorum]|uniref:Transposase n=1 Tax=Spirosoma foliorum TaxID=2710596 RepID=A0A7G5GWL2_9BACT|nr:transposase [Spirosoma foliorum]QMW03254.1 transposase [Spirosoma foliorum]